MNTRRVAIIAGGRTPFVKMGRAFADLGPQARRQLAGGRGSHPGHLPEDPWGVTSLQFGPSPEPPESELERQERQEEVKRAVYRLPLSMRSVLILRICDGLSFENLARLIKVTPAAARQRYSRALKRLRDDLPPQGAQL